MHDIRLWTPQRAQVFPLSIARWKTLLLRVFQRKCYRYVHTGMAVVHTCCRSPAYSRLCKLWDGCYLLFMALVRTYFFGSLHVAGARSASTARSLSSPRLTWRSQPQALSLRLLTGRRNQMNKKLTDPKSSFQELKTRVPINFTLRYSLNYWRSLPLWSFRLSRHL